MFLQPTCSECLILLTSTPICLLLTVSLKKNVKLLPCFSPRISQLLLPRKESHSTMKPIALLVDDSDGSDVDHEQPTAALVAALSSSSSSGVVVDLTGKRAWKPWATSGPFAPVVHCLF